MSAVKVTQKNPRWAKRLKGAYRQKQELAVGYPIGTKGTSTAYPEGDEKGKTVYVVDVASLQNFGSQSLGIPARPFMSIAKEPAIKDTAPISAALMPFLNAGKITQAEVLKKMGPKAVSAFQNTIVKIDEPPNSEATIARKKSSNPLIDTGLMLQTLTFSIRDKK